MSDETPELALEAVAVVGAEATVEWVRQTLQGLASESGFDCYRLKGSKRLGSLAKRIVDFYAFPPFSRFAALLGLPLKDSLKKLVVFDDSFFEDGQLGVLEQIRRSRGWRKNPFASPLVVFPTTFVVVSTRGDLARSRLLKAGADVVVDPTIEPENALVERLVSRHNAIVNEQEYSRYRSQAKSIRWLLLTVFLLPILLQACVHEYKANLPGGLWNWMSGGDTSSENGDAAGSENEKLTEKSATNGSVTPEVIKPDESDTEEKGTPADPDSESGEERSTNAEGVERESGNPANNLPE